MIRGKKTRPPLLRRSEWVLILYFSYTSLLALVLSLRPPIPAVTITMSAIAIAGFLLLGYVQPLRRNEFLTVLRDWYPLPLILLAYRQMGWFAPETHDYILEHAWVHWDRILLYDLHLRAAIESLGPLLPSILEISYSLVYTIPVFSMAMLYIYRRRQRANAFLFAFLLGTLLSYVQFPYFPSEPPRTVFPGQDFPTYETVFRQFNWWMLGGYGIHLSVFPSAHVSGAFSGAFAIVRLLPERRWVGRYLCVLAVLIATATVYGRYHYAADALAGFGVALVAQAVAMVFERRERLRLGCRI